MSANKAKALVPRPQIFTFGREDGMDGVITACVQELSTNGRAIIGLTFTKPGEPFDRDFGIKGAFLRMMAQMGGIHPYMQQWMPIIFKHEKILCSIDCPQPVVWKDKSGKTRHKIVEKTTTFPVAEMGRLDLSKYGYSRQVDGDAMTTVAELLQELFAQNVSNPGVLPNWVSSDFMKNFVGLRKGKNTPVKKVAKK